MTLFKCFGKQQRKLLLTLLASVGVLCAHAQAPAPAIPQDAPLEQRVEQVLKRLTLEEKIGQMTQLVIDICGSNEGGRGFVLDPQKLDRIIGQYKVGSILSAPGTVAQTTEKWQEIIQGLQERSMRETGIPCLYGLDQNHGTTYTLQGTFFPQNINLGASFDRRLTSEAARITAYETKAGNCPWVFSPTVDLGRDPRWPRMWENFGEDCLLNAEMGIAAVKGFQGEDPNRVGKSHVGVCVKHYLGYGSPLSGKDRTPVYASPTMLREKFFAPFLATVRAGALSVMANSGSINGMPVHASYEWLTKWLKEDLQWDGMIVTDWADINNLFQREKVARNKKEAIKMAINAGIDMAMEPYDTDFCDLLKELVEEGEVPMSRIDDATRRVLRLKFRLGLFDTPNFPREDYPLFGSNAHAQVALQAAAESMVLLKNKDRLLPLHKGQKVLVTGPNAHSMRCLNGGWSYTWQGHLANQFTEDYHTIFEALTEELGVENVSYVPGVTYHEKGSYWEENEPDIESAVEAARQADVIVACVGENSYCETPGNLTDLNLSAHQKALVRELARTGRPIVLVLNEGRPRLISDIEPLVQAVVDIMLPGNMGGDALARLLVGKANFCGKLPFTYPKEINSLFNYDYKVSEEMETMSGIYDYNAVVSAQWAFGYGLSYTSFAYKNLKVNRQEFLPTDELVFSVDVTNTGELPGKEAVLLFSSDLVASLTPDGRRLRAFDKVALQPGETRTVSLRIPASDLAFVGADGHWILEEGDFRIQVGTEVLNIRCGETKRWDTPNI